MRRTKLKTNGKLKKTLAAAISSVVKVSASQLEGWVFDPQLLSE